MEWTVKLVKELLPNIQVKTHHPKIQLGYITGRINPFATVTIDFITNGNGLYLNDWNSDCLPYIQYEVSWEKIVETLNHDQPLVVTTTGS